VSELVVRRARSAEYASLGELIVAAYTAGDALDPEADYVVSLRQVADRVASGARVLVAERDGEVVGTACVTPQGTEWSEVARPGESEFRMLAVAPHAMGGGPGGVAETLVRACLAEGRADGAHTMAISVIDHNTRAHRLYTRLGFTRVPDRDWSPVPGVRLLVWTRPLDDLGAPEARA
jgi:ribosomal protein S18 acetylase RimI-like enzyme